MKELFTVVTRCAHRQQYTNQYFASNLEELKAIIIENLISTANKGLSEREKLIIKLSQENKLLQMISIPHQINSWYFAVSGNAEINVIKTCRIISEQ